jgi:hypothetical protein
MRCFYFYHKTSGVLNQNTIVINAPNAENVALLNCPPEHKIIEGNFDPLSQRVDIETGQLIDYQPPQPSADHEWNADTKRWQLSAAAQSKLDGNTAAMTSISSGELRSLRAMRELLLVLSVEGAERDRLKAIDDEIVSLRPQLTTAPKTA